MRRSVRGMWFGMVAVGLLFWLVSPQLFLHGTPFASAAWKAAEFEGANVFGFHLPQDVTRAAMLDDLLRNHLRPGMSRQEVIRLLGPANVGDGTGDYEIADIYWLAAAPDWRYQVGFLLRRGKMNPNLWIEYQSGRVRSVRVR